MSSSKGDFGLPQKQKQPFWQGFVAGLRKRRVLETLAAFIGGGWLVLEFVDRILVAHYGLNKKWLDVAFITLLGALLCVILSQWFRRTEKKPGNVKIEVLLIPLAALATFSLDLNIIFKIAGISPKKQLIWIMALCAGLAWIVLKSLQWAAVSSPPAAKREEKSIVVLPFADLSPQKDQEYFCDGITEEIITDLSHVSGLRVISRNSAMTFKGTQKTTGTIGRELDVRYVLEGSVRKAGNDLRIAAQLINVANDAHLWADKFSGNLNDIFDIQEKVSRSIAEALQLKLKPEEKRKISERPIDNTAAYECYIRANSEIYRFREGALDRALQYLQNGLAMIGDNALLYTTMAYAYCVYASLAVGLEPYGARAEECVKKAFALNPDYPKAHAVLGLVYLNLRGNLNAGLLHLKRAIAFSPDEPLALQWLASSYILWIGKTQPALPLIEKSRQVDPLNPFNFFLEAASLVIHGRFDRALPPIQKSFAMDPDNPQYQHWHALILAQNKDYPKALSIIDQSAKTSPNHVWTQTSLLLKYGLLKDRERALMVLTPSYQSSVKRQPLGSVSVAEVLALLDEKKDALDWLEKGVNLGFINYPYLNEHDPFFENIRGEDRFKALMERVKSEWEHCEL